jgi:uncharacterized protein YcgI (DUF1989 family)
MSTLVEGRELLQTMVLEPGTGKAFELKAGQIMRIEQIEGNQCVDFNCFNLNDYREFMHCGRTRTLHGINPTEGDFMWSAPPRERAMVYILKDTVKCNDTMFPRCSANVYESLYGFDLHTNCHDIQSEAQREYGLTPDDVHDSFNLFMSTGVDEKGKTFVRRQDSKPGDHVDLLAMFDVLAVPNVCGSDVMKTSNFSIKAVKVSIFQATPEDLAKVPKLPGPWKSQRTPADFRIKNIKATRELTRDPDYKPEYPNTPILYKEYAIELSEEEAALLEAARLPVYGRDDGAALRDIVFSWWEENFIGTM